MNVRYGWKADIARRSLQQGMSGSLDTSVVDAMSGFADTRPANDQEWMMNFYRSNQGRRDLSLHMVRSLSATSLLSYPAGALTLALGPDTAGTDIVGYGFILLALISYAPLIGSSIQRVVGEQVKKLDEFELRLRGRALSLAYAAFTVLAMLVVLYAAIASDKGAWFPNSYEEFNGVFWGVFLYASVLPTAILSWIVEPSFSAE